MRTRSFSPIRSQDLWLTSQTRVDDIYEKEGKRGGTMTFVVTVQEFRDESGELVAEMRSTAIETGKPPTEG